MASVNKAILLGFLGRDPEVREFQNGIAVQLSLATQRRYKNNAGQTVDETEWHRIVLFGRLAEIARDYLKKGSRVYVEGRMRTRKYTDQQGVERYITEILGETLQFLDREGVAEEEAQQRPQRSAAPAAGRGTRRTTSAQSGHRQAASSAAPYEDDVSF